MLRRERPAPRCEVQMAAQVIKWRSREPSGRRACRRGASCIGAHAATPAACRPAACATGSGRPALGMRAHNNQGRQRSRCCQQWYCPLYQCIHEGGHSALGTQLIAPHHAVKPDQSSTCIASSRSRSCMTQFCAKVHQLPGSCAAASRCSIVSTCTHSSCTARTKFWGSA